MTDPILLALLEEMSTSIAEIRSRVDRIQMDAEGRLIVVLLERSAGQIATWRDDLPDVALKPA
jgi:hypothetical protein